MEVIRMTPGRAKAKPIRRGKQPVDPKPASGQTDSADTVIDREEIARLAYSYWQARGQSDGSPEADWFRAEEELRKASTAAAGR
jgi:hypothetical protein